MAGTIPMFDAGLDWASVTKLRGLNAKDLRGLKRPIAVITTGESFDGPLAVLIPYETWMIMQEIWLSSIGK